MPGLCEGKQKLKQIRTFSTLRPTAADQHGQWKDGEEKTGITKYNTIIWRLKYAQAFIIWDVVMFKIRIIVPIFY